MKILGLKPMSTWDRVENLIKFMDSPEYKNLNDLKKIQINSSNIPNKNLGKVFDKHA